MLKTIKNKVKPILKRTLVALLIIATLLPLGAPMVAEAAKPNSNDTRKLFLKMKSEQKISETELEQLDADSLRIIALFLSNYYIPFDTVLDGKKDSDKIKELEENMVTALTGAGFDSKTAKSIVKVVNQKSLGTAKPLVVDVEAVVMQGAITNAFSVLSKDHQGVTGASELSKKLKTSPDTSKQLPDGSYRLTYGALLGMLQGGTETNIYYAEDYDKAHSDSPVFSTDRYGLASLGIQLGNLDLKKGYGSAFYLRTEKKIKDLEGADDAKTMALLSLTSQLYVDWVGNIIMDTGDYRVVLLPACNNPYTFKIIGGNSGGRLNLVSYAGITALSDGRVYRYKPTDGDTNEVNGIEYRDARYCVAIKDGENYIRGLQYYRPARGSSSDTFDLKTGITGGGSLGSGGIIESAVKRLVSPAPFDFGTSNQQVAFPNWSSRVRDDTKDFPPKKGNVYLNLKQDGSESGILGLSSIVVADNLGSFEGDTEIPPLSQTNLATGYGYAGYKDVKKPLEPKFDNVKNTFSDPDGEEGGILGASVDPSIVNAVYMTYVYAYMNYVDGGLDAKFDSKTHVVDMVFDGDNFPQVDDNKINWDESEEDSLDELTAEVMSMVYYILHPFEGVKYVSVWAKNKISAVLLGWHEDMVGATTSNTSTGMTRYLGFTGYTTLPSLDDLSWTSWLMESYNSVIVYLIIIISVILCCYVIVGSLTGQRAILGGIMFAVLAFLPPLAINTTVNIVNNACDTIYGKKFTYWALVQHQSYIQDLYAAATGTEEGYKDFVLKSQVIGEGDAQTDNGYSTVKLKWMSPKKDNYMVRYAEQLNDKTQDSEDKGIVVSNMFNSLLSGQVSGEEFINSPEALYLYRDYMDVTMYSLKSYNLYSHYNDGGKVSFSDGDYKLQVGSHWMGDNPAKNMTYDSGYPFVNMVMSNYEDDSTYKIPGIQGSDLQSLSSIDHIRKGFMYNTYSGDDDGNKVEGDYYHSNTMATNYVLNYTSAYNYIYNSREALKRDIENKNVTIGKNLLQGYGIPQNKFNFTQSSLSSSETSTYNKEMLDYYYYGINSESPFYFFTFNTLDQMVSTNECNYQFSISKSNVPQLGKEGGIKELFLQDNLRYFFNYSENSGNGYGELRDFMNMHDFFYYVYPLMKQGNDLLYEYEDVYGMKLYDDLKLNFSMDGYLQVTDGGTTYKVKDIFDVNGNEVGVSSSSGATEITYKDLVKDWSDEKIFKFWHNYNTTIMFNAYCSWADAMADCNYAKQETINVAGKKYTVNNPLDPTSYFTIGDDGKTIVSGRPMIFSKSEMKYYGLKESDLTEVERKILKVQNSVYEKSIDLMNYYGFDDDVLVSAYAMLQLFEFNKEFSQTSPVREDFILYPQSYELKAFTYDAYLRLIISNTTGDSLQTESNQSLYERTMENSSITFGITMIILDVIAVYLIPAFKLFFLIVLFFMSILLIVASAVKIELNILNVVWKSLISPLLSFSAVSIGMAFLVSLFMYNGAKGVTVDNVPTIQLGEPTMVIIVMIAINAVTLYLYFKICRVAIKDFIKYARAVWENLSHTLAGALKVVTGTVIAGKVAHKLSQMSGSSSGSGVSNGGNSEGSGFHDASQAGKDNMPRPRQTQHDSGVATGATKAGAGGILLAKSTKQEKDNDVQRGKSKESYDAKMESGRAKISKRDSKMNSKRESYEAKGAGFKNGKVESQTKAMLQKERVTELSGDKSVSGNLAKATLNAQSKVNSAKGSYYSARETLHYAPDKAKRRAKSAVLNTKVGRGYTNYKNSVKVGGTNTTGGRDAFKKGKR